MKRIEVHHDGGDQNYADSASAASVGSSPRSVGAGKGSLTEDQLPPKWDDAAFLRVKLMCSYGGKILPRPHDNQLRYVGGETRIVVVNRNISFGELVLKLSRMFGVSVCIKYQLPSEDLDALISVTSDEDLENMMEECDRLQACNRPSRLRLFLFPRKIDNQTSISDLLDSNMNREHWFVDALNGLPISSRARSETSSVLSEIPDYLFGLDSLEDWSGSGHPMLTSSPNSRQNAAEKSSAALLGSLLHGSGEISSAPGSPMNKPAITTVPTASSAPPSMSSMPSAVVDAALQRPNQPKPAAGQLQMEQPSSDIPVQQKLKGSENQNAVEIIMQQVSNGLRQQQQQQQQQQQTFSETSKFPDQRFLQDEITTTMAKLISEQQQGVELPVRPVASKPKWQPQEPLQPTNINVMDPEKYNKYVDNAPLLDGVFESKEEISKYPREESPRYTKEENPRYTKEENPTYTRMVSKPAGEVKQEAEVQKAGPIVQGGEQIVKKVSEDRAGERVVEQMRKFDDQTFSRVQPVEAIMDSSQQADGFGSGSETQQQLGRAGIPVGGRDQSFVESSESEISIAKVMQGQDRLYAQIRDLQIESDEDSTSTYATQPPTVQLQNLANPYPFSKMAIPPSRMPPAQAPQILPRNVLVQQQPNAPANVYSESLPLRTAANPALPSSHVQRQTSDPAQHIPPVRVTSPYRDHPSAHALPSRFRGAGPPVYTNPPEMKRVLVRSAGPQVQQSRPPLVPQYSDQVPYSVPTHVAYIDPNAAYTNYSQFPVPTAAQYTGLNPFVEDMRPSPEVLAPRYQEVYIDPVQDPQGMIDGRLQGRQYMMRN